jgi:hypothetical protein
MATEIASMTESSLTVGTRIRHFTSMDTKMAGQCALLFEALAACCTFKGSLTLLKKQK